MAWRRVAFEVLILDLVTSQYYRLNQIGALLWERIATASEPVTADHLIAELVETHGVSPAQAVIDIERFLDRLTGFELLEI